MAEAKACTAPLASMRMSKTTSEGGGVVRVRCHASASARWRDAVILASTPFRLRAAGPPRH